MDKAEYSVSLRNGLSLDAKVLADIGVAGDMQSAIDLAFSYINDSKNLDMLGCKSFYCRQITFKEGEDVGIDYGSHSMFVIVKMVSKLDK